MGIKDDRSWYDEWYRQHVGSPPNGPTLWERENRARIAKARRRGRWLRPLQRIPSFIVAAAVIAVIAQGGYYLTHGLNAEDTLRAIGYDWRYYGSKVIPGLDGTDGGDDVAPDGNSPGAWLLAPRQEAVAVLVESE